MKKLFALLLTVVMMASMMVPAMAEGGEEGTPATTGYAAITPGYTFTVGETTYNNSTYIDHSLTLTEDDITELWYDITYKFAVSNMTIVDADANGMETGNQGLAITGNPTIANITYTPKDNFNNDAQTVEKKLIIDWSKVSITQPGIYRWTVNQTVEYTSPNALDPEKPSNANELFYIFLYVGDNGEKLTSTFTWSKQITTAKNPVEGRLEGEPLWGETKEDSLPEQFPVANVELQINKIVDGEKASREQYFRFKIELTVPRFENNEVTDDNITFMLGGKYDVDVPATAYHQAQENPEGSITMENYTKTFYIWLKHGQSFVIHDIPYGASYTITEDHNEGYEVTPTVTGDQPTNATGSVVNDTSLIADATVQYKNEKNLTVPTGISLQSGVAFFGFVLAMGMMMLMFVGKRKEQN